MSGARGGQVHAGRSDLTNRMGLRWVRDQLAEVVFVVGVVV